MLNIQNYIIILLYIMSSYSPPIENTAIFDTVNFSAADISLTQALADKRYLRFPNAQGIENLQTTNVNGLATFNAEVNMNKKLTMTGTVDSDRLIENTYYKLIDSATGISNGSLVSSSGTWFYDNNFNGGKHDFYNNTAGGSQVNTLSLSSSDLVINTTNPPTCSATQPAATDDSTKIPTTAWVQNTIRQQSILFDEMMYQQGFGSGASQVGLRPTGTFSSTPFSVGGETNHPGVVRCVSSTTSGAVAAVSSYSSFAPTYLSLSNIKKGSHGAVFVFRPFVGDTGVTDTNTEVVVGIWINGTVPSSQTAGAYWRYGGAAGNNWSFYIGNTAVPGATISGTLVNQWVRIEIIRNSNDTFTSTMETLSGTIVSASGTGTPANLAAQTYIGFLWVSTATTNISRTMDLDYIGIDVNGTR
jgi:hypothetical protein